MMLVWGFWTRLSKKSGSKLDATGKSRRWFWLWFRKSPSAVFKFNRIRFKFGLGVVFLE